MRTRTTAILLALVFTAVQAATGETAKTLPAKNTYGGSTVQTEFVPGDKFLDEYSIIKTVALYDGDNSLKQADYYYTADFGNNKGYAQKSEFYGTNQKAVQGVYLYTKLFSDQKGYYKSTDYYNEKGKVVGQVFEYIEKFANESGYIRSATVLFQGFIKSWEYDYIESFAKKIGYWKRVDFYVYDPYGNGKITEQAFYDKDGKEIKRGKPE